jgi:hypothetical protein
VQNVLDFFAGTIDRSLIVNAGALQPQNVSVLR